MRLIMRVSDLVVSIYSIVAMSIDADQVCDSKEKQDAIAEDV